MDPVLFVTITLKSRILEDKTVLGLFMLQVRGKLGEQLPVSTERLPVCVCVADWPLPAHHRCSGAIHGRRCTPPQNRQTQRCEKHNKYTQVESIPDGVT